MIEAVNYVRKPFRVQAVQVTEENMAEVAQWCNGTVVTDDKPHVKVNVKRPQSPRQSRAEVGDWVLLGQTGGFKVYLPGPFERGFDVDETLNIDERLDGLQEKLDIQ